MKRLKIWFHTLRATAWLMGALGALLLFAGFTGFILARTRAPSIDESRATYRQKILAQMRATNQVLSTTYGWIDPTKGIVRLPISRAVELSLQIWGDPAAGRSNLLARLAKATAQAPPKPNPYE